MLDPVTVNPTLDEISNYGLYPEYLSIEEYVVPGAPPQPVIFLSIATRVTSRPTAIYR